MSDKAEPSRDGLAEIAPHYLGHRDRVRAIRQALAGEDFGSLGTVEPIRVESEMDCQRAVQLDQPRRCDRCGRHAGEKVGRQRRVGILEGEMHGHADNIGSSRH